MHASARYHALRTRRGASALLATLVAGLLAAAGAAHAQQLKLTQPAGAQGCLSESGGEPCADADVLSGPFSVALSRDGRHGYVALIEGRGVAALARDKRTGALSQLPSPAGCVSQTGSGGACATGRGLHAPVSVAVAPDGEHVYVASHQRDPVTLSSLALFARDATTGALTQLPGVDGCISEDLPAEECTPGRAIKFAYSVAVSPDGKHVYVAGESDAVAAFARDAETGRLTQLPGPDGCVSQSGHGGACTKGKALDGAYAVVVSKNGKFVYVAAAASEAVAVFSRNKKTGRLTQLPGEAGCISDNGALEQCTDGVGLDAPDSLALSPNGKNLYVASQFSDQLAVLARDTKSGTLSSLHCIEDGGGVVCEPAVALRQPDSVAVSPDGKRVYVAARDSSAVTVFARDRATGSLAQLATTDGCVSESGSGGLCADGRALNGARALAVSKNGKHVYVAAQGSDAVAILQRSR